MVYTQRDGSVVVNLKKLAIYGGIAFVIFYLVTQPTDAASAVNSAAAWVQNAADSISTFVSSLGGT